MNRRQKYTVIFIAPLIVFLTMPLFGMVLLAQFGVSEMPGISIISPEGVEVIYDMYIPSKPVKAQSPLVVIVHGLGVNRRQMRIFALALAADGYYVITPEHRGHGSSGGTLTHNHTAGAQDVLAAINDAVLRLGSNINTTSIVLIGHSMGGAIVTVMGNSSSVRAVIGIAPLPEEWAVSPELPPNYLLITGAFDGAISLDAHIKFFQKLINSTNIEYNKIYGNISEGTGRMFYVDPDSNHGTEMLDKEIYVTVRGWIALATETLPGDTDIEKLVIINVLIFALPLIATPLIVTTLLIYYQRRRDEGFQKIENMKNYIFKWIKSQVLFLPITVGITCLLLLMFPVFYGSTYAGIFCGITVPIMKLIPHSNIKKNLFNFDRKDIIIGIGIGAIEIAALTHAMNGFFAPFPSIYMAWALVSMIVLFGISTALLESYFYPVREHYGRTSKGMVLSTMVEGGLISIATILPQFILAVVMQQWLILLMGILGCVIFFFLSIITQATYGITKRALPNIIIKACFLGILSTAISCRVDTILVLFSINSKT